MYGSDSAVVSEQIFAIPENIYVREEPDGKEYENHLLAAPDTGIAKIKLDGWEADLIDEEARRPDFVCWLRNPAKASWALRLPYDINNEKKSFYPDFLIVRSDPAVDYVVDILEPYGNQYADMVENIGKKLQNITHAPSFLYLSLIESRNSPRAACTKR